MSDESEDDIPIPRGYTLLLFKRYKVLHDREKRFWIYNPDSGLWKDNASIILEKDLRKYLLPKEKEEISRRIVGEILADTQSLASQDIKLPEAPWHFIPFENGYYDLKTESFRRYSSEVYFTSKLQVKYNEKAICPFIDGIFSQLVPPEKVVDLYELSAYSLIRYYPYQKVFFLYGSGGNGKSVFARILEMLIGQHNISHVSLTDFQKNRFSKAELDGKFINMCTELDYQDLTRTDVLKQLTGGDSIQVEKKFQHPYNFINYAKLIFLTNELPRTTDKTNAFYRRVFLINFPYTFDGENADRSLLDKIGRNEVEGLAFKCLGILKTLMGRNFSFTNDQAITRLMEDYERVSNPFDTFISECCETTNTAFITKQEFKERFYEWLKQKGYRLWDDKAIKEAMMKHDFYEEKKKVGDNRPNCWVGLKLKV